MQRTAAVARHPARSHAALVPLLDEVRLREPADFLVPLYLVAAVGAAGGVVLDGVVVLEAGVRGCVGIVPLSGCARGAGGA